MSACAFPDCRQTANIKKMIVVKGSRYFVSVCNTHKTFPLDKLEERNRSMDKIIEGLTGMVNDALKASEIMAAGRNYHGAYVKELEAKTMAAIVEMIKTGSFNY